MGAERVKAGGEWLKVPNLPYLINRRTMKVWSERNGRTLSQSSPITIHGKQYNFRPAKLLFAAMHGVDPRDIDSERYVVCMTDDGPALKERGYFSAVNARKSAEARNANCGCGDVESDYQRQIEFARKALKAFQSGDWSEVVGEIEGCREDVKRGIRKVFRLGERSRQRVDDLWAEISDSCLTAIRDRGRAINNPKAYMMRVVTSMFSEYVRKRRKVKRYDERRTY